MKYLWLLLFIPVLAYADINSERQPSIDNYVSQGIYLSSNTAIVSTEVRVATYTALLHMVNVNSGGSSGAKFEIFDASQSTSAPTSRKIATIDSTSKASFTYDVYCASGISINNTGTNPADVTVIYRVK